MKNTGILRIQAFGARQSSPIEGVLVTVSGNGFTAQRITDETGTAGDLSIEAPSCALSLQEDNTIRPYAVVDLTAAKAGFRTVRIQGVQIFAGQVTLAQPEMIPETEEDRDVVNPPIVIPEHSLFTGDGGSGPDPMENCVPRVLHRVIIPLLPLYVCGTFIDMTKSGKTYAILGILWKVFLVVIIMHLVCIFLQFCVAGAVSHKSPFKMIRNQIPGYTTALGTQSSAATIPVNLQCAAADGVSEQIRNFVVPLCANIHMAGSMITITACATAVCLMNQLPISLATVVPFIMTLGVAMVASPGAPGGSIMTALPFLYMIFGAEAGDPNGPICAIMVALYITQDSFGTACNVSGDNAIGVIVETIYQKFINKSSASV